LAPSGAIATPNSSLASGSESGNPSDSGTMRSGGTTRGGGARHPLVHEVYCPHWTQLWNFFVTCNGINKGLGLKSCEDYNISYINPMRVYEKPMHGCVG
jgi:hypothetical protein